jgi:hypothetical protein
MAPSCDKQFPNAYYMLATLFAETNIDEALRCCALAEQAENERLPFHNNNDIHVTYNLFTN